MVTQKGKITTFQAILLFLTAVYTPTVRLVASFTADKAKQAAWISPVVSFFLLIIIVIIIHAVYKRYNDVSFMDAIYDIFGVVIGKIIVFSYTIFMMILLALHPFQF